MKRAIITFSIILIIYKACYDESTETIAIVTDVTNNTY